MSDDCISRGCILRIADGTVAPVLLVEGRMPSVEEGGVCGRRGGSDRVRCWWIGINLAIIVIMQMQILYDKYGRVSSLLKGMLTLSNDSRNVWQKSYVNIIHITTNFIYYINRKQKSKNNFCNYRYKKSLYYFVDCILIFCIILSFSGVALAESGKITSATPSTFTAGTKSIVTVTIYNSGSSTTTFRVDPTSAPSGWKIDDQELDLDNYRTITLNAFSTGSVTFEFTPPSNGGSGTVSWDLYYDKGWLSGWGWLFYYAQSINAPIIYSVTVKSNQASANVYLDNVYKGITSWNLLCLCNKYDISGVPAGAHTIKLTKSGYNDAIDSFTLSGDTTRTIDLTETTYSVIINSNPSVADVYFDNVYKGSTPYTVSGVKAGSHTVKLTKSGYLDYSQTITVPTTTSLNPTLTPLTYIVTVKSNQASANVYLDNIYKGITSWNLLCLCNKYDISGVLAGAHTIKLTKSGYNDAIDSFTLSGDTTRTIDLTETTYSVIINSNPSVADIYFDNVYKGSTPYTVSGVKAGSHTVKLTKSGYLDYSQTITVPTTTSLNPTLTPLTYTVTVKSNQAGANVYLDNFYKGTTSWIVSCSCNMLDISGVPAGPHTIKLTKSGYNDAIDSFSLSGATIRTIDLTETTYSVIINSNPSGADVYFDNVYKGLTPFTIPGVKAGSHVVKLTKSGYSDYSQTIIVPDTTSLSPTLIPNPAILDFGITSPDQSIPTNGPLVVGLDEDVRLWYNLKNPLTTNINVILGGSLRRQSTGEILDDSLNDKTVTLQASNTFWYSRWFKINNTYNSGTYDVAYGLMTADKSAHYQTTWKTGWLVVNTNSYPVSLTSSADDGSTNIGSIKFGADSYNLPQSISKQYRLTKYYSVEAVAPVGYNFDRWEGLDGVQVNDLGYSFGKISVTSAGTLKAIFKKAPTFNLSINPETLSLKPGDIESLDAVVKSLNGFTGNVEVGFGWGTSSGNWFNNVVFNPTKIITLSAGEQKTVNISFDLSNSATPGTYTMDVSAFNSTIYKHKNLQLVIQKAVLPPSPSITTSTTSLDISPGESKTISFTVVNNGAPSSDISHASFSVSNGLEMVSWSDNSGMNWDGNPHNPNTNINYCDGSGSFLAENQLIEGSKAWGSGDSSTISITLKAKSTVSGSQWIKYRATMYPLDSVWSDPNFRDPNSGYQDQQLCYAKILSISVKNENWQEWQKISEKLSDQSVNEYSILVNPSAPSSIVSQLPLKQNEINAIKIVDKNGNVISSPLREQVLFDAQSLARFRYNVTNFHLTNPIKSYHLQSKTRTDYLNISYTMTVPDHTTDLFQHLFIFHGIFVGFFLPIVGLDNYGHRKEMWEDVILNVALQPGVYDNPSEDILLKEELKEIFEQSELSTTVIQAIINNCDKTLNCDKIFILKPTEIQTSFGETSQYPNWKDVTIRKLRVQHLEKVSNTFSAANVVVEIDADALRMEYLNALANAKASERMEVLRNYIISNKDSLDPALVEGSEMAEKKLNEIHNSSYDRLSNIVKSASQLDILLKISLIKIQSTDWWNSHPEYAKVALPYYISYFIYSSYYDSSYEIQKASLASTLQSKLSIYLNNQQSSISNDKNSVEYVLNLFNIEHYLGYYYYKKDFEVLTGAILPKMYYDLFNGNVYSSFLNDVESDMNRNLMNIKQTSSPYFLSGWEHYSWDDKSWLIDRLNSLPNSPKLSISISEDNDPVISGASTKVAIAVNYIGSPVSGANVLVSINGGSCSPTSGTTNINGIFYCNYIAPDVSSQKTYEIIASISKVGYNNGNATGTITVNPLPIPYGSLYVTSNPSDAEVYLNPEASPRGISPLTISDIPVGEYSITLKKSNYHECTKTITVSKNQQATVNCDLSPIPAQGFTVSFDLSPRIGTIQIDNKYYFELPKSFYWEQNTEHTISINPIMIGNTGIQYTFNRWNDGNTQTTRTITVSGDISYTAEYKTQNYLSLSTNPENLVIISGAGWYDKDTPVTLNAPTVIGHLFKGWTIDGSSVSGTTISVTMNVPHTIIANYEPLIPTAITVSPFSASLVVGETKTFSAADQNGNPVSVTWVSSNTTVGTIDLNTGVFTAKAVGMTSIIATNGTVNGTATVTVPENKYNISFDTSPRTSPIPINIDSVEYKSSQLPKTFKWERNSQHSVSVNPIIEESVVCIVVVGVPCSPETTRYLFNSWNDSNTQTSRTIIVSDNASYIARYKTQNYLYIITSPENIALIPGSGWYDNGTSVSLIALPVYGYNFNNWIVDGKSISGNSININMTSPHTITAVYQPNLPTITTQPLNQTVNVGQNATFTVVATGTAPLTYKWQKNGTDIPGAISASHTTPATTLADNGTTFRVNVSNTAGSVISNTAILTVISPPNPSEDIEAEVTSIWGSSRPIIIFGQNSALGGIVKSDLETSPISEPLPAYTVCLGPRNSDKSVISRFKISDTKVKIVADITGGTEYYPGSKGYIKIINPEWKITEILPVNMEGTGNWSMATNYEGTGVNIDINNGTITWYGRGGCPACGCYENGIRMEFIVEKASKFAVHNINKDTHYTTIQAAINDSSPGDEIHVDSGTYFENVNVTKRLILRGIGMPVVDARGSGSAITLSAHGITLEGFTVTGAGSNTEAGINVISNSNTVRDNNATSNSQGIFLNSSNFNNITSNNISNSTSVGIRVYDTSTDNTIRGNKVINSNSGMFLVYAFNTTASDNIMENNSFNFGVGGNLISHFDRNNIDTTNLANGRPVYYVINGKNTVYGSSIKASTFYCILCNNVTIKDMEISNMDKGVYFWSTSKSRIQNITVKKSGWGIFLRNSSNNSITDSKFSTNNLQHYSERGVTIYSSNDNTLTNSTFILNNYGLELYSSSKNTIYNNYFNNTNNFLFTGTTYVNIWNTTKKPGTNVIGGSVLGGNFWDNQSGKGFSQTCLDNNNDGLCDQEYSINISNIDYLPLTYNPSTPGITVTSPNGGENWVKGTTRIIRWNYSGSPGSNVRIELLKGAVSTTINSSVPIGSGGNGSYAWLINSTQITGTDYRVRITSTANSIYNDTSDNNFIISSSVPTITVVSPNGGENWIRGTTQKINWTFNGSTGAYVKIELLKNGVLNRVITYGTSNNGSYSWQIPVAQAPGTDYKVRITSTTTFTIKDTSDNNFAIPTPTITVLIPNGTENWIRGTTHWINWTSINNPGPNVKIELLKNGVLNRVITYSTPNNGSYSWPIPVAQVPGTDYKVRITSTTTTTIKDISDNNFTIPTPTITVLIPNGTENWIRGTTHWINWTSTNNPGPNVKIELLKNGLLNRVITYSTPNNGSYSWLIPVAQVPGSDYRIRITSTTTITIKDISDNNFTIPTPTITVVSPDGGENWIRGTTHWINWTSTNNPGPNVKIELLKNGLLNRVITYSTPNDGSYSWLIPAIQATGIDYKVRITSTTSTAYKDDSNTNFIIRS